MRNPSLYYVSAFISGLAVMAVELSAARLLAPYFGSSLYVWTNVIGLVMVALAGGYYFGGRLADKRPLNEVYFALIFITGLWVLFIPFFAPTLFDGLVKSFENLALIVKWGSFFAVAFLFVFPLFMMGMVVPFTVKMVVKDVRHMGSQSGQISMVSTAGSLVGSFLPAFVLIPYLGTTNTFVFVGLLMIFNAAWGLKKWWVLLVALAGVSLFWLTPPVYASDDVIYAKDSPYGYIFVTEDSTGVRRLHVDNPLGTQSIFDPDSVLPEERYYYSYFGLLPAMMDEPKKVLILGHAGGSFTRIFNAYYPELAITGIEIDPAITLAATETMELDEANVKIVHADARTFLLTTDENYDLILADTYHGMNIPPHLATEEFFELAQSRLNEGGILAINVASGESEMLTVLENTLANTFAKVAEFPIPDSYNTMVLARDEGEFTMKNVPTQLFEKAAVFDAETIAATSGETFTDDKMTRIELLTEDMLMNLMKQFKQD